MSYEISVKIQKVLDDILSLEVVQKALKFIEEDAKATVAE